MAIPAVRNWFGLAPRLQAGPTPKIQPAGAAPQAEAAGPRPNWTRERLAITDTLWGEGYQSPGGEMETVRLAKPLGFSVASSVLLLGAGAGGAACSLVTQLGVGVSGFEADPDLVAAGMERIAQKNLTKRARIETWDPNEPVFRKAFYHHGLALEPLRGSQPESVLAAIAGALKAGGQLMMTELVADAPLDPAAAPWARLECRDPASLPTEVAITRILGRLGFDVRAVEDLSERHRRQALAGWRTAVHAMETARPSPEQAMLLVREAELWLLRLRLFQLGRLRLVRWNAIRGGN
jgi:cyclopropane fatty-acyl-phospholipid synthase-like methyltransferase